MGRREEPKTPEEIDADRRTAIDKSGFPFQVAVERRIQDTATSHGWSVLPHEHPWYDARTGQDAFIDILIEKAGIRGIIECKRSIEVEWSFLVPRDKRTVGTARLACGLVCSIGPRHASKAIHYEEIALQPVLPEAEFCAVNAAAGQKQPRDEQMLERIAAPVARAAYAVAEQAMETERHGGKSEHIYLPIVVTNARLSLCNFDPSQVSLSSGVLPRHEKVDDVNAVYFRRSIGSAKTGPLRQIQQASERTVLVVRAEYLEELLPGVFVSGIGPMKRFEDQIS